ncbi:radical SAM family heme chaperone HemW [Deltaproteobacteria bacterium TL4]
MTNVLPDVKYSVEQNEKYVKRPLPSIPGIYIHIPFCRKICPFCPFTVRKDRGELHESYLDLIQQEMRLRAEQFHSQLEPLHSIYLGGGTPSSLTVSEIETLMKTIKNHFELSQPVEISMELNPEDVRLEYLQGLFSLGINRISLGGQSFFPEILKTLGRNHTAQQHQQAVELMRHSPFENYNVDLMFGIPGQTLEMFQNDVKKITAAKPKHLSLYGLDIEPDTPFAHQPEIVAWVQNNQVLFESMYLWAIEYLSQQGFEHYEVANFAQKGFRSVSNLLVWSGLPYLGFGVSAHSYVPNQRWANVQSLRLYADKLNQATEPVAFVENLTGSQQANETLMLGLRQTKGLDLRHWARVFKIEWSSTQQKLVTKLCEENYAEWNDPLLQLKPKGLLIADGITARLMLFETPGLRAK